MIITIALCILLMTDDCCLCTVMLTSDLGEQSIVLYFLFNSLEKFATYLIITRKKEKKSNLLCLLNAAIISFQSILSQLLCKPEN